MRRSVIAVVIGIVATVTACSGKTEGQPIASSLESPALATPPPPLTPPAPTSSLPSNPRLEEKDFTSIGFIRVTGRTPLTPGTTEWEHEEPTFAILVEQDGMIVGLRDKKGEFRCSVKRTDGVRLEPGGANLVFKPEQLRQLIAHGETKSFELTSYDVKFGTITCLRR